MINKGLQYATLQIIIMDSTVRIFYKQGHRSKVVTMSLYNILLCVD